ncbi:MAG: adenylyltransferase/cytidyltransferase family protein [Hyphomicrobium sp.]|uniref:PfkB family carbohydrate kinase n=1 Tax=Hyphomicrobium sp. TaxID=82 RepID=UPI00132A9731|nr:PfkB family carbohydrate kinase [Hyphomicrobium sp.]KAB2939003.1 MAG: adenylyltransferase/cytidyltransferase family protein [Hyphomicrobium sp.]MBZ0211769.1 adenylyltransferase/cytidyltransferase family protein [Hyphomicrobium sp.]
MSPSLSQMFGHKIKSLEEVRSAVGSHPRKKKVIMCHGVFDVVHPGHLRHLLYAKSKADVLIASLTADQHIAKGTHRPHVPQDLRAANLAAFEMVDYVIIDKNATPIENIKLIQPDFFAKGYEYGANGPNMKTAEEVAALHSYGGEIIFTPGDIVYSSSRLIDLAPPKIRYDKLLVLMEREQLTFNHLRETLAAMASKRVHVVGDTIVDSLTRCAMIGGQTKTPTMSVLYEQRIDYVGGAGIVAEHLRAAGAEVVFSTVLGNDSLAEFALDRLKTSGVDARPIIDPTRPTTNKNAIVVDGYRLLKVDTLDNRSIADGILDQLVDSVKTTPTDAVVYSDFRHGMFNRRTIPTLVDAIPDGVHKVADSQVASRWGNITDFKGFDLITPNEREARFALGDQDSGIRPLASGVYNAAACKILILKLGDRGILTCQSPHHTELNSFFVLDSFVDHVVDAVGAGDALLAYATLATLVSGSPAQAAILGSMAAACECERDGNIPIAPTDMEAKIATVERHVEFA